MQDRLTKRALDYPHDGWSPGKGLGCSLQALPDGQRSRPGLHTGVAKPVLAIEANPEDPTSTPPRKPVAVISNGTAILGLGDRGALASKPVMEARVSCSRDLPHRRVRHRVVMKGPL
jgi:malate dehydrogenase (oxaloacetate-decarboxylating)(NADP+)